MQAMFNKAHNPGNYARHSTGRLLPRAIYVHSILVLGPMCAGLVSIAKTKDTILDDDTQHTFACTNRPLNQRQ